MLNWSRASWQAFVYEQSVNYADSQQLEEVLIQLNSLAPLVTVEAIQKLKFWVAKAGRGEVFILQGGDCAEAFEDCQASIIYNKLNILLKMQDCLEKAIQKPVIKIGRIAGQYAKPRTSDIETIENLSLPSYRGDLVNGPAFTAEARKPDPLLMLKGYQSASKTLAYIDLLLKDLRFSSEFFTSHEALHLPYEEALTREKNGLWYNFSTHLPWIGMRTATLNSAHVEFLRGVQNPIGVKVGPSTSPEILCKLLAILNPNYLEGRLLLITRFGQKEVSKFLPPLIKAVQDSAIPVTWSCDPMHGNTEFTKLGIKTRRFDNIVSELTETINIHNRLDSILGAVHFELSGDQVTECLGGNQGLTEEDLQTAYKSLVDPRLNYDQSLEIAKLLGKHLRNVSINNAQQLAYP